MKNKTKKTAILSLVAVMTLSCGAAVATSFTPDFSWSKTVKAEGLYDLEIGNKEELISFANRVNQGETFEGKVVALTADIDLGGMTWTPIGYDSYGTNPDEAVSFNGTFDGCGYTISNFTDNGYTPTIVTHGEYGYGLFGYAYGANFKNVTLKNVNIYADGVEEGDGAGVAALVGYYRIKNGSPFVIENCHLESGSIYATNNMGGLVGYMYGNSDGDAKQTLYLDGTIADCTNSATVTTKLREAGGIVGLVDFPAKKVKGDLLFKNCENYGAITANAGAGNSCAGGILGRDNTGALWYFGGRIVFDSCYNNGTIKAIGNPGDEVHSSGMGTVYNIGGMTASVKNCVNEGEIILEGSGNHLYLGEILATAGYAMIENCTVTDYSKLYGRAYRMLFVEQPGVTINENAAAILYLNGGRAPEILTFGEKGAAKEKNIIEKDDYFFDGWYNNPEFTGDPVTFNNGGNDRGIFYAKFITLDEMYARSNDAITFESDITSTGFVLDKDITIDLNGNTFNFSAKARATSRVKARAIGGASLQLTPGINVTIKNGTIAGDDSVIVQNSANLTLENVTIDARKLDEEQPALVNYEGTTILKNSNILTAEEGVALEIRDNGNKNEVELDNTDFGGKIVLTETTEGSFGGKLILGGEEITEAGLYAPLGNEPILKVDVYTLSVTTDKTALKAGESFTATIAIDKAYYSAEYTFKYDVNNFICAADIDGDGEIFVTGLYEGAAGDLATYTLTAKNKIEAVYNSVVSVEGNVIQYKEQVLNSIKNEVLGGTASIKLSLNYTASVVKDYISGYSLVLVKGDDEGYAYNGVKMFYVEVYEAYALIVKGDVTTEAIDAALSKTEGCEVLSLSYNVNAEYVTDGVVDLKDATAVYTCLNDGYGIDEYMELYLRADVNGDGRVNVVDINEVVKNYTK